MAVIGLHDVSQGPIYAQSCKMLQPPILPLNHKNEIGAFSMGIRLAKCLTQNISATMRDMGLVRTDHRLETMYRESSGHVTDDAM